MREGGRVGVREGREGGGREDREKGRGERSRRGVRKGGSIACSDPLPNMLGKGH